MSALTSGFAAKFRTLSVLSILQSVGPHIKRKCGFSWRPPPATFGGDTTQWCWGRAKVGLVAPAEFEADAGEVVVAVGQDGVAHSLGPLSDDQGQIASGSRSRQALRSASSWVQFCLR